jgi:DNA-binding NarL/FixJ family response regulator
MDDLHPDVVLAALPLADLAPAVDGPAPPIVLLAAESSVRWSQEVWRLGVRALMPPNASSASVLAAVDSVAAGLAVIDPAELKSLLSSTAPVELLGDSPALTPRELDVLRMMADGAANKTIAWKLDISEHTAKFHVASILGKLNASSRTEAVTAGFRKGLILL